MKKTTMYILGGAVAVVAIGGIAYAVTRKPAAGANSNTLPQGSTPNGGGGGGSGSAVIQGNNLIKAPAPTAPNQNNPTSQPFQNPAQFAQDLSNFLNTMKIAGIGFDTLNALYTGIQSFAASNLNFYLPALSPQSFGFLF